MGSAKNFPVRDDQNRQIANVRMVGLNGQYQAELHVSGDRGQGKPLCLVGYWHNEEPSDFCRKLVEYMKLNKFGAVTDADGTPQYFTGKKDDLPRLYNWKLAKRVD